MHASTQENFVYASFLHYTGCFYFTLGNMRPQLRSSVKAIQLITLAKTSDISQYGICPILQCITNDILQLEKVGKYATDKNNYCDNNC